MSLLNNTLKSLDARDSSDDFGLPPTVNVTRQFPVKRTILVVLVVLALLWVVLSSSKDAELSDPAITSPQANTKNEKRSSNDSQLVDGIEQSALEPKAPNQKILEQAATEKQPADATAAQQGMQATPLDSADIAAQQQQVSVAAQAFTQDSDDDEAPYRAQAEARQKLTEVREPAVDNRASVSEEPAKAILSATDSTNGSLVANESPEANVMVKNGVEMNAMASTSEAASSTSVGMVTRQNNVSVAPKSMEKQSEVHLAAGIRSFEFGMFEDAQDSFMRALEASPENNSARERLVALLYGQNNSDEALAYLAQGMRSQPANLLWRELAAKILIEQTRYADVLAIMPDDLDITALTEKRADYLIIKGTVAQALESHKKAMSAFSAMTKLQPNLGKWWLALGISSEALEYTALATQAYTSAISKGGLSADSEQYVIQRLHVLQEQY
ncbi:tetratricopeptide repeat protein [Alteromonas sp. 1_MG-2023]|uniref:tetratricopeptide repeat protein n=1 Tax=Alteromonas sp. 1_MG-2023 TaxID=3062669 RepID=UPI0026E1ADF2|nr:tetratricopeptide repeat protein [Alteromonas sp. 1_MG-2023]MDO6566690.1 tetratricopeptide repeat protein [Alteromonas sp. 1_MG-2023]